MFGNYIKRKYDWVRKNPVKASWIGFIKGILYTILFYEFIL